MNRKSINLFSNYPVFCILGEYFEKDVNRLFELNEVSLISLLYTETMKIEIEIKMKLYQSALTNFTWF